MPVGGYWITNTMKEERLGFDFVASRIFITTLPPCTVCIVPIRRRVITNWGSISMKKVIVLFALTSLFLSNMAYGQIDPDDNAIGVYFDEAATWVCITP